jgi:TP901 family phage tail tape measure protein
VWIGARSGANRLAGVLLPLAVDSSAWNSGLGRASRSLNAFAGGLRIAGFRLALVTAPLVAASAAVFKFSTDFESAMTGVRKTVNPTVKQFDLLNKGILEMSKIIPIPAVELARITQLAGQFGINTENLLDFTEALGKLSIAAEDLPTEEAAIGLARFISLTDAGQKDVEKLASIIAVLGDKLATSESRILDFAVRIAASGTIVGVASEEILALGGAFSALVSGVERSSTAVERSFGELKTALAEGGKELELFAFVASKSGKVTREEFAKTLQQDAGKAIEAFIGGLKAIEDEGGNSIKVLKDLGLGNIRTRQSFLSAAVGASTFGKAMQLARDEAKLFEEGNRDQSKLQQEFANRLQDTQARLILLANNIKAAAVILGGSFLPLIKQGITFAIGFVGVLEDLAKQFAALPEATRSTVLQFSTWLFVAGPLLIALGTIIATVVALSSVILPLGLGVVALLGTWKAFTGESLDLGSALLFLFEAIVEGIAIVRDFDSGIQLLLIDFLKLVKVTAFYNEAMLEIVSGGKLVTPTIERINTLIKGLQVQAAGGIAKTVKFQQSLGKLKDRVTDLAARLKQGADGFGEFEDIIDEATSTLDKIKKELAATAKNAKKVGEEIAGAGDAADMAVGKLSTAAEQISKSFGELTKENLAQGVLNFIKGVTDALKKGEISKPFREKFLKDFETLWKGLEDQPEVRAALAEFAENSGILIGGIMPAAMAKEFADQFATPIWIS